MRRKVKPSFGIAVAVALALLVLSGCGENDKSQNQNETSDNIESTTEEKVPPTEEEQEETGEEASSNEPAEETQEETGEEASSNEPAEETQEAGPFEGDCSATNVGTLLDPDEWLYLPGAGSVIAVVGVEHWDILEIHEDPGVSSPLVGTLDPLDDTVVALGFARQLPQSIWWCISWDGGSGAWASSYYLSRMADPWQNFNPDDWVGLTAQNLEDFLSDVEDQYERDPNAEGGPMRIVISELDYVNNILSVDVIGLMDDSNSGIRFTFFTSTQTDGSFVITDAQYRAMCMRGGGPGSDLCL